MTSEWTEAVETPRRSRRWLWWTLLLVLIFVLGAAAGIYALRQSGRARQWVGLDPNVAAGPTMAVAAANGPAGNPTVQPSLPTDLLPRLARVEQSVTQLAERATETSSNAERAEGLLVAFATRRALDRGTQLGYIEGLLRDRFGEGQPQAVATILSASRQPVTLEELQTGLDAVAPQLIARSTEESWWQGMQRELAGLIVVRRASTPSFAPADRLTRARRQLELGHVDLALVEVARLPGRAVATDWIAKARRYASARSALDLVETAALLAPRRAVTPDPVTVPVAGTEPEPVAQPTLATALTDTEI